MDQPDRKSATPAMRALDAGLILAVFAFLTWILSSHVPSNDPFYIWLWGGIGASCLTGVFWLCLQMFRAVLRAQLAARKK
jgi:carboxypeptidase C (cathepsin A)